MEFDVFLKTFIYFCIGVADGLQEKSVPLIRKFKSRTYKSII